MRCKIKVGVLFVVWCLGYRRVKPAGATEITVVISIAYDFIVYANFVKTESGISKPSVWGSFFVSAWE